MSRSSIVFVLSIAAAAACGPSSKHDGPGGPGGPGATVDGSTGTSADAPACATSMVKAEETPLDLFIMLDQSGSMSDSVSGGGTKWTAVTGALNTFVHQPGLDGISVGIQYFGQPASGGTCSTLFCQTDADCGASACGPCIANACIGAVGSIGGDSCTAADYAQADVEIAPLPGVASMISSSMSAHSPTTNTPTSAALQGAINHATAWGQSHAGDAVVVVLATDGDPTECDTSMANIDAIAAAGAAQTPKILTFVIGVGASLSNLNGIAAAGGTTSAFLVDTSANVNQQFLAAMNAIRNAALGCQYQIPMPVSGAPDYGAVNVVYTPGSGGPETFPYVMNQASCPASGNGWYYDDPANPTQILLCPSTCSEVQADQAGEVDITLGCSTVIL
jgi:hypothetical protein